MYCNMLCVQVCTIRLGALCGESLLLHNIVLSEDDCGLERHICGSRQERGRKRERRGEGK